MADHLKASGSTGHLLYGPTGHLLYQCSSSSPPCDECCDCQPTNLTVVIAGVHASVNGAWTVPKSNSGTTCGWIYDDANVTITVASNFDVTAIDKSGPTTRFTGVNTVDHRGACNRVATNAEANTVGTGTAIVTGSCTPTCAAVACAEDFDPPDNVLFPASPCGVCSCPSCVPGAFSVVLSGVTECLGTCCGAFFIGTIIDSITITNPFTLEFANSTVGSPSTCTWGDPAAAPSTYWKVVGSASGRRYRTDDCSDTAYGDANTWTVDILARYVIRSDNAGFLLIAIFPPTGLLAYYFDGVEVGCTGGIITNDLVDCCDASAYGGTATITPC